MSEESPSLESQVKTAKEHLESCHGLAISNGNAERALAYYESIVSIEAALDDQLQGVDEPSFIDSSETIKRSREAREEGYAAATLEDQRRPDLEDPEPGLLARLWRLFK